MILNVLLALIIAAFCMFFVLALVHIVAYIPYDRIVTKPHIAVSTAVSASIAFQLGPTFIVGMLCFVGAIIGCFLGQMVFSQVFDPKRLSK